MGLFFFGRVNLKTIIKLKSKKVSLAFSNQPVTKTLTK